MHHLRMGNAIQWNHLKPSLATSATSDTVVEDLTMLITDVKANCSWSDCYRGMRFFLDLLCWFKLGTSHLLHINSIFLEFCFPGWNYFQGSCYFFSSTPKSWNDSQTHCTRESAYLVNIGSEMENEFINGQISDRNWLGLKEISGNQSNWIDDDSEPVYVNWNKGQPLYQDGRDECIYTQSGTWSSEDCRHSLLFVCEKGKPRCLCSKNELHRQS